MEKLIINKDTKEDIINNLLKLNIDIVKTEKNNNVLEPISTHPDILVHNLPNGEIIVDRDNYDYYLENLKGFKLIKSKNKLTKDYPGDISLNAVNYKNLFIHNFKYTDEYIYNYYKNNGYTMINVKQGYTKCNIAVGKNVLITSDKDIYEKVKEYAKVLLIEHKGILLKGFNYGFIGGTSGLINDTLYFTGSLKNHSSYSEIIKFLEENNEKYEFLSEDEAIDYGSIILLKNC